MNYREYRTGDTIRVTGCQGRLFCSDSNRELNSDVSLGIECELIGSEDSRHDVRLPRGILTNDQTYLSVACIELVQAAEDKLSSAIEQFIISPDYQSFRITDPATQSDIAQIWYGRNRMPEEVAKAFIENIKDSYDDIITKRKTMNSKKEITYEEATENNLNKIAEITKDCVDKCIQEYYGDDWKNTDREADEIGVFDYDKLTYFLYNDTGYVWIDQLDNMFSVVTEKFIKSRFNLTECNEYLGCALNIEYNQKYLIIGTHTFYPPYSDTGAGDFSVNSMIEEVHYKTGLCEKFIKHLLILIDIRRRNFKKKTNLVMRVIL